MSNRIQRIEIAKETIQIAEQGFYINPNGDTVSIKALIDKAKQCTVLYKPEEFKNILESCRDLVDKKDEKIITKFQVNNETTLNAAMRLSKNDTFLNVACLNFASARNPGGGFLNGSQAQEESLARASALYPCIAQMTEYYDANRKFKSTFYTDNMIFSPKVPIFRDDSGILLDNPYLLSIITAPAVNTGAVYRNEREKKGKIEEVMKSRIEKVISIAIVNKVDAIILGAWGCGVFMNNPTDIARYFQESLIQNNSFSTWFKCVSFAVLDRSEDKKFLTPFEKFFN